MRLLFEKGQKWMILRLFLCEGGKCYKTKRLNGQEKRRPKKHSPKDQKQAQGPQQKVLSPDVALMPFTLRTRAPRGLKNT